MKTEPDMHGAVNAVARRQWLMKCLYVSFRGIMLSVIFLLGQFAGGCNSNAVAPNALAEIKITFHDTLVDGSIMRRIDMTVLQTEIIDINDNKVVISSERHSFNLLEITKNNPVVLAHTMIAPGIYKQIRLILDSNTTITLTDGKTHPLKVPSGEQTGIKIDGVFSIPAGKLYTLDIDLDPGRSVHYAAGQGYMLKPVIEITGSEVNAGNFFYAGSYNNDAFVTKLNLDGTMDAKTARYPKYVIKGYYVHDGVNQKLTIVPQEVTCPGCSRWERLKMKLFADVPSAMTYDVITFAADYIALREVTSRAEYHLFRVPTFSLGHVPPSKEFTLEVVVPTSMWAGKTLIAQLVPEDGNGRVFSAVDTIPDNLKSSFDFSIPKNEFDESIKNYILLMAVVESPDDLTLRSDGTVADLRNLINHNADNAILLRVSRDSVAQAPLVVLFNPSL